MNYDQYDLNTHEQTFLVLEHLVLDLERRLNELERRPKKVERPWTAMNKMWTNTNDDQYDLNAMNSVNKPWTRTFGSFKTLNAIQTNWKDDQNGLNDFWWTWNIVNKQEWWLNGHERLILELFGKTLNGYSLRGDLILMMENDFEKLSSIIKAYMMVCDTYFHSFLKSYRLHRKPQKMSHLTIWTHNTP